MAGDGFGSVVGAGGIKAASSAQHGRKKNAVTMHRAEENARGNARRGIYVRVGFGEGGGAGGEEIFASRRSNSSERSEKLACAEGPRGCMTMSHPEAISWRCWRRISRMRRRMRLRTTAPPRALRTLMPNRLRSSPLGRKKTTNGGQARRWPWRCTASNSERCSRRPSRRQRFRLDAGEGVAPFCAASCKDFPSACGFHARAEAVFFVAAPHVGLKGAFRQGSLLSPQNCTRTKRLVYATRAERSRKARLSLTDTQKREVLREETVLSP
jgi:hypothetical protein